MVPSLLAETKIVLAHAGVIHQHIDGAEALGNRPRALIHRVVEGWTTKKVLA
jgi:hypothetical protein